jgi:hypothetical protein
VTAPLLSRPPAQFRKHLARVRVAEFLPCARRCWTRRLCRTTSTSTSSTGRRRTCSL